MSLAHCGGPWPSTGRRKEGGGRKEVEKWGQGERRERSDGGEEEEKEKEVKENETGASGAVYMELSVVAHLTSIPVSTSMKVFRISCSFCSKITTTLAL